MKVMWNKNLDLSVKINIFGCIYMFNFINMQYLQVQFLFRDMYIKDTFIPFIIFREICGNRNPLPGPHQYMPVQESLVMVLLIT